MHRHINHAGLNIDVFDLANKSGDSLRDLHATRRNSREHNFLKLRVALDNFVRNPSKRATNCFRVHDWDGGGWILFCLLHAFPWRPRGIGLKEKFRRRTFRCAPPSFAALASWSDVSRSNQAELSQSQCLCQPSRSQSIYASKSPRVRQETPYKAPNPLRIDLDLLPKGASRVSVLS